MNIVTNMITYTKMFSSFSYKEKELLNLL